MTDTVADAIKLVAPIILFGLVMWFAFGALKGKFLVVLVTFLATYTLAESPLGTATWHWLGTIAKAAGLLTFLHYLF
jgi:hypothetical protein